MTKHEMRWARLAAAASCAGLLVSGVASAQPAKRPATPSRPAAAQGTPPASATPAGKGPSATAAPEAPGSAEAPTREQALESARTAYRAGEAAYRNGDFATAAREFARANAVLPSPQAAYWGAMSLDSAGDVPAAIAAFRAFLADPAKDRAGADRVAVAEARLTELLKAPATFALKVPAGATVTVDGVAQPSSPELTLKLSPGKHLLHVALAGHESEDLEIDVEPGAKATHEVTLALAPAPLPAAASPNGEVAEAAGSERASNQVAGWITVGLAGAGVAVGTVFGVKALTAKDRYNDNPTESGADDVERDALIADMAFGAALTLGVTGLVLLTTTPEADPAMGRAPRPALVVAPYASRHGGGASAEFTF